MTSHKDKVLDFWNERANFGETAGSNDFLLKELEERALLNCVPPNARVLDIGCGNGATLLRLVAENSCSGVGLDYAEKLLDLAGKAAAEGDVDKSIQFRKGDVLNLPADINGYDHVITQRCLINLETYEEQVQAFENILRTLRPGGRYYMIESFNDGNRKLNAIREPLGLEPMTAPWHNRFFEMADCLTWQEKYPVKIQEISHFASTYYFLSRVVYARLAADKGESLRYDSEINLLSMKLPPIDEFGATKLVVWQKRS